jgi:hypothetical protein
LLRWQDSSEGTSSPSVVHTRKGTVLLSGAVTEAHNVIICLFCTRCL